MSEIFVPQTLICFSFAAILAEFAVPGMKPSDLAKLVVALTSASGGRRRTW